MKQTCSTWVRLLLAVQLLGIGGVHWLIRCDQAGSQFGSANYSWLVLLFLYGAPVLVIAVARGLPRGAWLRLLLAESLLTVTAFIAALPLVQ